MFKQMALIVLVSLTALVTGCGTTAKFVYPADGHNLVRFSAGPTYQRRVAVTPFEDMRGDRNVASTYFLYLIPLMPFGYGEYERPDAARMFNTINEFDFDASEDLAKAAAFSLKKSGLFTDAFFTYGGDKDKADLLLEGEMLSTTYRGTLWTYGLSVYGPLLWFLGLPAGTSNNDLKLWLKVTDLTTGNRVWEKNYEVNHKIVQGLYYRFGHDVKGYSYLMQEIMNDVINDINREFQKQDIK